MKKTIKWISVILYSAVIFLTLPYGPDVIRWLSGVLDKNKISIILAGIIEKLISKKVSGYDMIGWIAAIIIFISLIFLFIKIIKSQNKLKKIFWFTGIFLVYGYFLIKMEIPTEKIHFIEYGLLSLFIISALKQSVFDRTIYSISCAAAYMIGLIDETIQHFLPNRSGEFDDVMWNAAACWLIILLIGKCFPPNLTPRILKRNLLISNIIIITAFISSAIFLNCIPDYGYKISSENISFFSRISENEIKSIDSSEAISTTALINTSDDSSYGNFIDKYNAKEFPFIHELRVHIFRRDRYLAYYQHYKYMNDLADGKASGNIEEIKSIKFNKYLYSYILKSLESKKITFIDDNSLLLYIEDMKIKAKEIIGGIRKKESEDSLKNYLTVSYNENKILEKYFESSIKSSKFFWKDGEQTYLEELLKSDKNKDYVSEVSKCIITGISKLHINIIAIFLSLSVLIFSKKYIKINSTGINSLILMVIAAVILNCSTPSSSGYKLTVIKSEQIVIDGIPDEKVWKKIKPINKFYNIKTGELTENHTVAKILLNEENLYVSFVCKDDFFSVDETKRDGKVYNDDCVEIFIDPEGRGEKYFEFEVSPINTVFDAEIIYNGGNINFDKAILWNCGFLETGANRHNSGYSAEIKIPVASIFPKGYDKYPDAKFNVYRIDKSKDSYTFYAFGKTKNWFHEPEFFKKLILKK